jgi:hypothetical protein
MDHLLKQEIGTITVGIGKVARCPAFTIIRFLLEGETVPSKGGF